MRGLSPVAASRDHSPSRCAGLSPSRPLLLRSTGSRRAGSVVVAHGLSCSAACGIFPDQGSNPCALHWQADSQPLHHQGSPTLEVFTRLSFCRDGRKELVGCINTVTCKKQNNVLKQLVLDHWHFLNNTEKYYGDTNHQSSMNKGQVIKNVNYCADSINFII